MCFRGSRGHAHEDSSEEGSAEEEAAIPHWLESPNTVSTAFTAEEDDLFKNWSSALETSRFSSSALTAGPGHRRWQSYDGLNKRCTRNEIGLTILKSLIDAGRDPEAIMTHGRSALMVSVICDDLDFVKVLIEKHGVDINKKNEMGETALSLASEKPELKMIAEYLRSMGALDIERAS